MDTSILVFGGVRPRLIGGRLRPPGGGDGFLLIHRKGRRLCRRRARAASRRKGRRGGGAPLRTGGAVALLFALVGGACRAAPARIYLLGGIVPNGITVHQGEVILAGHDVTPDLLPLPVRVAISPAGQQQIVPLSLPAAAAGGGVAEAVSPAGTVFAGVTYPTLTDPSMAGLALWSAEPAGQDVRQDFAAHADDLSVVAVDDSGRASAGNAIPQAGAPRQAWLQVGDRRLPLGSPDGTAGESRVFGANADMSVLVGASSESRLDVESTATYWDHAGNAHPLLFSSRGSAAVAVSRDPACVMIVGSDGGRPCLWQRQGDQWVQTIIAAHTGALPGDWQTTGYSGLAVTDDGLVLWGRAGGLLAPAVVYVWDLQQRWRGSIPPNGSLAARWPGSISLDAFMAAFSDVGSVGPFTLDSIRGVAAETGTSGAEEIAIAAIVTVEGHFEGACIILHVPG